MAFRFFKRPLPLWSNLKKTTLRAIRVLGRIWRRANKDTHVRARCSEGCQKYRQNNNYQLVFNHTHLNPSFLLICHGLRAIFVNYTSKKGVSLKVLIIWGTGYVGARLNKHLSAKGFDVYTTNRKAHGLAKTLIGDVTDAHFITSLASQSFDAVVYTVSLNHT